MNDVLTSLLLLSFIISLLSAKAKEAEWLHQANGITFSFKRNNCSGADFMVCQVSPTKDGAVLGLAEYQALHLETGPTLTSSKAPMPG